MTVLLYPPLALIETELFGGGPVAPVELDDTGGNVAAGPMPAYLAELVRRRVASDAAWPPQAPAAGQIRRLDTGRACGVLLGASQGGQRWRGWLVAQEADYAAERDLVLQEEDGIVAPEAAMVQAWNPVEVRIAGDEALLGKLSAAMLGAVMRLADLQATLGDGAVLPRPGRIGAWDLEQGTTVVTGTPLGEADDPRHAYQRLYRRLAGQVQVTALTQQRPALASGAVFGWLRDTFVRPAWTFGALALVAAQGLWMLDEQASRDDGAMVYRSGAGPGNAGGCAPRLRVVFRADAAYGDIVGALRQVQATLVQGPSEDGEIWVSVPAGPDARAAAALLADSPVVEQADTAPAHPECAR